MTVQTIYDMAIHLMDEQNETTGETRTVDTQEYKFRTISILNTAIPELYPYSGNYPKSKGRPNPPLLKQGSFTNPDFTQEVELDASLCATLLPLYLAAQLLSAENEALSQWFMNMYKSSYYEMRSRVPAAFEAIATPYGLF